MGKETLVTKLVRYSCGCVGFPSLALPPLNNELTAEVQNPIIIKSCDADDPQDQYGWATHRDFRDKSYEVLIPDQAHELLKPIQKAVWMGSLAREGALVLRTILRCMEAE